MSKSARIKILFTLIDCLIITSGASCSSLNAQVAPQSPPQLPEIIPFYFSQNVHENQSLSLRCITPSSELPITFTWLKDDQLLTPSLSQAYGIVVESDRGQSLLKLASAGPEQAGNYTCVARNNDGSQSRSAQFAFDALASRMQQSSPIKSKYMKLRHS